MSLYNLIEYSNNYATECLWQCCRDKPALNNAGAITDFPADANNSASFNFKPEQQAEQTTMLQKMLK